MKIAESEIIVKYLKLNLIKQYLYRMKILSIAQSKSRLIQISKQIKFFSFIEYKDFIYILDLK